MSLSPDSLPLPGDKPRTMLDGWLRRRLLQRLAPLRHGALQLEDAWGSQRLGVPTDPAPVQLRVEEGTASRDQVKAVQDAFGVAG